MIIGIFLTRAGIRTVGEIRKTPDANLRRYPRLEPDRVAFLRKTRAARSACRVGVKGEGEMMVPRNLLWTPEEDDELRSSILASKDIATIAKQLNRTQKAIRRRATKLKLPLKVVAVGLKEKPAK